MNLAIVTSNQFYIFIASTKDLNVLQMYLLMLVSQIFELASHCLVYSNHKHTHRVFQYECLLEQSVLAATSVSESVLAAS